MAQPRTRAARRVWAIRTGLCRPRSTFGTHLAGAGGADMFRGARHAHFRLLPLVLPRRVHLRAPPRIGGRQRGRGGVRLWLAECRLVYGYGLALPVVLWITLRYLGVGESSVVEVIAAWRYSIFVWTPVAVRGVRSSVYTILMSSPSSPCAPSAGPSSASPSHCRATSSIAMSNPSSDPPKPAQSASSSSSSRLSTRASRPRSRFFFSYYILVPNAPAPTPPLGGDAGGNTTETGAAEVVRRIFFS
ncbi:hypothetical protein K438DRAFT_1125186 [Mycena galopus ATCC 62051]|nr:hypothetical protein K438DRAFT_1125186 [Mycena galopus ATCC 62051]